MSNGTMNNGTTNGGSPQQQFFADLAARVEGTGPAPARLKSRIYSALVRAQQSSGPLLDLVRTHAAGQGLCVFEHLVSIAPVGESLKSLNPCQVCHARVLAENLKRAPIYWNHCPYAEFQKG